MTPYMMYNHDNHKQSGHPLSHKLAWTAGIAAATITLSPYFLPWLGIGTESTRFQTEGLLHLHNPSDVPGVAGFLNSGLSSIPLIGSVLASGGFAPILISAAVGIGGTLLANWLAKHETNDTGIKWSKVIRIASLASSMLIALPSILTGISAGLSFMALAAGDQGSIVNKIYNTVGIANGHTGATNALGAIIPHILLCGASLIPVGLTYWLGGKTHNPNPKITKETQTDYQGRLGPSFVAQAHGLA